MTCPDQLTLDLWLAEALPPSEASSVAAHVASCARCSIEVERQRVAATSLRTRLALDQDELAYLANLSLSSAWRNRLATSTDARWGWLALFGLVAAFITWTVAAYPITAAIDTANQLGLATILVTTAVGALLGVAEALLQLSTNPALALSQPLLALLALALVLWPRIGSAPTFLEGVRS
jgi:hypothetical protein